MSSEELFGRQAVVLGSAVVYWAGVAVQARRVRRRIGRTPNVGPQGLKERLLWAGWLAVVLGWMLLPFLAGRKGLPLVLSPIPSLMHPAGWLLGALLMAAGYAGTLWCYAIMGNTWRMGINRREKTTLVTAGPYGRIRHPIYAFQVVMLLAVLLLLPIPAALAILGLHLACVLVKAADEEAHLLSVHGQSYREYLARTGRLLPRLRPAKKPAAG